MRQKKELVKKFFQIILDKLHDQENGNTRFPDYSSIHSISKVDDFDNTKKQIVKTISPHEIEGIVNCCFSELFQIKDRCCIQIIKNNPNKLSELNSYSGVPSIDQLGPDGYGIYYFIEDTNKLYFFRLSTARSYPFNAIKIDDLNQMKDCPLEEIKINDLNKFKILLKEVMGNPLNNYKILNQEAISKLITDNTGHIPDRYINQAEANRFLRASRDLIESIHDRSQTKNHYLAIALTTLACLPIVTIPFCNSIFKYISSYLYSSQDIHRLENDKPTSEEMETYVKDRIHFNQKTINQRLERIKGELYDNNEIRTGDIIPANEIMTELHPWHVFACHTEEAANRRYYTIPYIKKSDIFSKTGELRPIYSKKDYNLKSSFNPILWTKGQHERKERIVDNLNDSRKRSRENIEKIKSEIYNSRRF